MLTPIAIYEAAVTQNHWIYDPQLKRWQTPEEFLENEQRYGWGRAGQIIQAPGARSDGWGECFLCTVAGLEGSDGNFCGARFGIL